jgi:hypothetical protein
VNYRSASLSRGPEARDQQTSATVFDDAPEMHRFEDAGSIPNSQLSVLVDLDVEKSPAARVRGAVCA